MVEPNEEPADQPIAWVWALILIGCAGAMFVMWWFDLFDNAGVTR